MRWKRDRETGLMLPLGAGKSAMFGAAGGGGGVSHDYECELYWATVSCGNGDEEWGYCDEFYLCSSCNNVGGDIRAIGGGTAPTTPNGYEITGLRMVADVSLEDYLIFLYVHDSSGNLHTLATGDITALIMNQSGTEHDAGPPQSVHRPNGFDGYYRWSNYINEWPTFGTNAWHEVYIDGSNF